MEEISREKIVMKAQISYASGVEYKEISEELNVPVNTLKSWRRRYGWRRNFLEEKKKDASSVHKLGNNLRSEIKKGLLDQLETNNTNQPHQKDLVEDYMKFWDLKNTYQDDIVEKGIWITWVNGSQSGEKKNDSVGDLFKTNTQMLKILTELNLKPTVTLKNDDDDEI